MEALHFLVPGPLFQRTGGFLYDARMARELEALGVEIQVRELRGTFPGPDRRAASSLADGLRSVPDGAVTVVDGLAMGAHPDPVEAHCSRVRTVALVHHPLADEPGLGAGARHELVELEARALAACHGAVVTSPFTARRLQDFGLPPHRTRAVLPGTDPAPRAPGPTAGRPPRLLAVGAAIPRKGYDVLLEALGRLRDSAWECVIAGSLSRDPAHAQELRRLLRETGLEERVQLAGECDGATLERLYASSSLFVLPSRYEGYGMVLAEAMARGLPVVSTRAGAIPETVPQGVGILVPPDDAGALAEGLAPLLTEGESERERLGRAARRHARTLPPWRVSAQRFAEVVEELAEAGDEPAGRAPPGRGAADR